MTLSSSAFDEPPKQEGPVFLENQHSFLCTEMCHNLQEDPVIGEHLNRFKMMIGFCWQVM